MVRLRNLAVAFGCLLSASCGAHGLSLYPTPSASAQPYTALDRVRAERRGDARRIFASYERPAYAAPLERRAYAPALSMEPFGEPSEVVATAVVDDVRIDSDNERFACADGSVLEVRYSDDRDAATARWGDGAPIALTRVEGERFPTYGAGETTFRRLGPRASWSDGEDAVAGGATVTVAPGDTLSKIALARYGSYDQVAAILAANADRISDPNLIFPGQVLVLPGAEPGAGVERSCRRTAVQPA
jgi:hypothetical protein